MNAKQEIADQLCRFPKRTQLALCAGFLRGMSCREEFSDDREFLMLASQLLLDQYMKEVEHYEPNESQSHSA